MPDVPFNDPFNEMLSGSVTGRSTLARPIPTQPLQTHPTGEAHREIRTSETAELQWASVKAAVARRASVNLNTEAT